MHPLWNKQGEKFIGMVPIEPDRRYVLVALEVLCDAGDYLFE